MYLKVNYTSYFFSALVISTEEAFSPVAYIRHSDQCAAQFRSQYSNFHLLHIRQNVSPQLETACFSYFKSHKGKNSSDTVGSLAKQAFFRASGCIGIGNDRVGNEESDQEMAIAEDGRVGGFLFFRLPIDISSSNLTRFKGQLILVAVIL